jgi:hypothetical protein
MEKTIRAIVWDGRTYSEGLTYERVAIPDVH